MSVKITLQGQKRLIKNLDSLGDGLNKLKKPLQKASDLLKEVFDKNFPAKGAELGSGWQPRKRSYPHPILQKTGKMRKGFRDKVSNTKAVIDNPTSYFKYHQLGTKHLPVRLMLKLDSQREKQIIDIFEQYVKQQTNKLSHS